MQRDHDHHPDRRAVDVLVENLSPLWIAACMLVLLAADVACQHAGTALLPGGILDEIAHFLTALLLLQALPARLRRELALPALFASVAIDLDHVPQYLGYGFLTAGTPRPYTHSLLTIAVLATAGLLLARRRRLLLGLALGVALHFFRDLAEGNGSGVALLWPLSDHGFSYPHAAYLTMMVAVGLAAACASALRLRPLAEAT
jgi:inner membrane protein